MARWICTIVENNYFKNRHLREHVRTYGYPEKTNEIGMQRALKILQMELCQPKTNKNNNNLTFKNTFNPNNPKQYLV